ncbi:MAG: hypothetical protein CSA34_04975 [Desulfobulbus propionicus]|nr:MAG: hypothetical protein CSA34_04975 [Desulfobulbus propionicus]
MQIATTHKNTDFDALSSIIAVTLLYPGAVAVCPSMVNPNVQRFLSLHKTSFDLVLPGEINPALVERLIVVDVNQWRRLDRMEGLRAKKGLEILLWDHHLQPGDIDASFRCVEPVGACITLLIRELKKQKIVLTPLQATVFLIGLYEDTGQLTFSSTTAEDAYAAAYLLEQGADLTIAAEFLNTAYEETHKQVLFHLMRDAKQLEIRGFTVAVAIVSLDCYVNDLAKVVQLYRKIVSADVVFGIFINASGSIFIIGRSGTPEVDVSHVLQPFGGGGHPGAGSAMIQDQAANPEHIREELLLALNEEGKTVARVADMMSFPVATVPPDMPMYEVQDRMEAEGIRGILVEDADRIVGIVVLWDFKKLRFEKQWTSPVKAFMNRKVVTIEPGALAGEAAQLMVERDIGHLPVVQDGKVIGIVTRTDVVNYLYGLLPA